MTRLRTTPFKQHKYRRVVLASPLAVGILLGCSGTNNTVSPTSTGGASLNGGSSSTGGVSSGGVGGATSAVSAGGLSSGGNASGGTGGTATGGAGTSGTSSAGGTSSTGGAATASTWVNVRIGGGGYVDGLVFHPTTANLLYARTDVGGTYRWNDVSSTWVPLNDALGPDESEWFGAESIALDPTDSNKVYLMTGRYIGNTTYSWDPGKAKLMISSDQGATWTEVSMGFWAGSNDVGRAMGERLAVDPNMPNILFYGTRTMGLWKSIDSGSTWSQVGSSTFPAQITRDGSSDVGINFVLFDTSTTNSGTATQSLYVGVAPNYASAYGLSSNLYKSADGGNNWSAVSTPYSSYFIPHMVRTTANTFYLSFNNHTGPGANNISNTTVSPVGYVYKFDGSSSWTKLLSGSNTGFNGLDAVRNNIAASTSNFGSNTGAWTADVLFASRDGGSTWNEVTKGPHNVDGADYLYAGGTVPSYWGWVDNIAIDPTHPDRVFYTGIWSTTTSSGLFSSGNATPTWTYSTRDFEETVALAVVAPPSTASYLLVSGHGDFSGFVHTSLTTSPSFYTDMYFGNVTGVDLAWNNPSYIVQVGRSTTSSNTGGYYSTNSGSSWTAFTPPVTAQADSHVTVSADASTVLWAVTGYGPYYSSNNGNSWTLSGGPAKPAAGYGYTVAADRKTAAKLYAYDANAGKVYYSTDYGHTFTASASSITTSTSGASLSSNPNAAGDVWLTNGPSVYHSTDSGVTWNEVASSLITGATGVALGKPANGSSYSAAVYLLGTISATTGVFRSDDFGTTWNRINDNSHQFGGIAVIAADQSTYGRVYLGTGGRGIVYNQP